MHSKTESFDKIVLKVLVNMNLVYSILTPRVFLKIIRHKENYLANIQPAMDFNPQYQKDF